MADVLVWCAVMAAVLLITTSVVVSLVREVLRDRRIRREQRQRRDSF